MDDDIKIERILTKERAPSTSDRLPAGYFALDIETTGEHMFRDKCFAIGLAYGSGLNDVVTSNFCLDLKKPPDTLWKLHWSNEGWQMNCYYDFWSRHESVLDKLQNKKEVTLYESEKEMFLAFDGALNEIESKFESVSLVTDTTAFDTSWLNFLLQMHGHEDLAHKRNGEYRRGGCFELDSYMMGVFGVHASKKTKPWLEDEEFRKIVDSPHDHHPEHDALHIYQSWFATLNAIDRKTKLSKTDASK